MKYLPASINALSISVLASAIHEDCKCRLLFSLSEWTTLSITLNGALLCGIPPGSVCYLDQPNHKPDACAFVASQRFNSSYHSDPVSIDQPIWTNNSCYPIFPNGTSVTGEPGVGARGCDIGDYSVYVVNAKRAEQVSTALTCAGEKIISIVVKSTGHSYQGRSIGYGSLGIWTHHFRGIEYIEEFKPLSFPFDDTLTTARVAAGHSEMEVQEVMSKHGMVVVTGVNPDVGVIGWLTGGGHGPLSTTYDMGAENLLEATIVTLDDRTLLANPCQNSDFFFAIRGGGGGTFGASNATAKVFACNWAEYECFATECDFAIHTNEFNSMLIILGPVTNPLLTGHMIACPNLPSYFPNLSSLNPAWRRTLTHLIVVSSFPDRTPRSLDDAVYIDIIYNKTEALRRLGLDMGGALQ
ncbi:FAD-binding domain-containing protein [Clathrospora elynae]|uniref:FAD-binding domain-containing protein n=1 Tax=Clathrospora elynae TaxID=706981 RepID=A0A6A5SN89_9PLEO|nr:FAD-binding domain-containing protein [Clathrospora elynae]